MITLPVRELNQRTAQVLDEVTVSGESAWITKNGVVRWRIDPASASPGSSLETLMRSGLVTRPRADLPLPPGPTAVPSGRSVEELLDDIDGPEPW